MKKLFKTVLALTLLFILSSCTSIDSTEENIVITEEMYGVWVATSVLMMGVDIDPYEVAPGGIKLELEQNGTGELFINYIVYDFLWTVEGDQIVISEPEPVDSADLYGEFIDNTLKLINVAGMGYDVILSKE